MNKQPVVSLRVVEVVVLVDIEPSLVLLRQPPRHAHVAARVVVRQPGGRHLGDSEKNI